MADTQAETPSLRVVDDSSVREIFATNAVTGLLSDSTLLITLAAQRALPEYAGSAPSEGPVAQVTARLALTPTAAVELMNFLNTLLSAIPGVSFAPTNQSKPQ